MNSRLLFPLKVAFGLTVLAVLVWRIGPAEISGVLRDVEWRFVWYALAVQAVAKAVWAIRWQLVLRACNVERSFTELLGLVHVGLFFNTFLPSSIGGDAVRGYYASNSKQNLAASYGALIVERLIGLVILAALCAVASISAIVLGLDLPQQVLLASAVVSLGVCVAAPVLLLGNLLARPMAMVASRFPRVGRLVAELTSGWSVLRQSRALLAGVCAASAALQVLAIFFYVVCAWALKIDISWVTFFVVVPISVVASMLPVSLNGLGLREGVFVALLYEQGVELAVAGAFSLLALVLATVFSVIGGFVYMFWRPVRDSDTSVTLAKTADGEAP